MESSPKRQLYDAVASNNPEQVRHILARHPELLHNERGPGWLHEAASEGAIGVIDELIRQGIPIDDRTSGAGDTPLIYAIRKEDLATAKYLLGLKANPSTSRALIAAINCDDLAFDFVKLLHECGANINESWRFGDERNGPWVNALSWAEASGKCDIADYLRAHGAKLPMDVQDNVPGNLHQEIIAHFGRQFGPVMPQALREVVPSSFPVEIHVVPATKEHAFTTLFTTGMSDQPMSVPPGGEAFQFAELLIHLPSSWPLDLHSMKRPESRWPMDWLRRIASYPHQQQTWLGGPITIISNGTPPDPLGPQCRFTALLLMADFEEAKSIQLTDGRTVRLYTLMPLYPEEHSIEQTQGLPELFRRFDRLGTPKVVDTKRRNVARLYAP